MRINSMRISEIKPYENNPRKNDAAVDMVANSISRFGFQQPIVVDRNHVIIVGHTRYKAAKKLGLKEVPVLIANELSDEQAKAYRLADNKTNELADWDLSALNDEFRNLESDFDMTDFGFAEKGGSEWFEKRKHFENRTADSGGKGSRKGNSYSVGVVGQRKGNSKKVK